jgi:hypothetical protein
MKLPLRSVHFYVKVRKKFGKNGEKFLDNLRLRKGRDFFGQLLHRGEIFFSKTWYVILYMKNADFLLCRFQNMNFTPKKVLAKKDAKILGPLFRRNNRKKNKKRN